ncbi:MAG: MarR family transcriptional regulator [Boseongicola sp.]|nr:MarR family transcriptional regulator [Boseongicola sp.]
MSAFDLEEFLPYQLAVLAERTSRAFEAEYRARFGIGVAEWRVLAHLSQSPSVSVRDIQKQVAMEKSRVSRAASRLEASGFILRRPDPGDGRLIALELTAKGRDLIATMAPVAAAFEAEMMERLGADGDAFRRALLALLSDS